MPSLPTRGPEHARSRPGLASNVSFCSAPSLSSRERWDDKKQERLEIVEAELRAAQKRWSEEQELYYDEVEALLKAKKEAQKFTRKRAKDHQREGRRLEASPKEEYEELNWNEQEVREVWAIDWTLN
ncbi:MAG: hypothetical protein M1819_001086 [Sarea resinae]|nr:MAG: hypothetical protein M1819_001086 [Sarea resinae]